MPIISNFPTGGYHAGRVDNPHVVTKSQIGLANVDNTSDEEKPVSSKQAAAIADAKQTGTTAIELTRNHTQNQANPHGVTAAQVGAATNAALNAHTGNRSNPHGVTAGQIGAATTSALSSHTSNKSNPHSVTRAQVGAAPDGYGLGGKGRRTLDISQNINDLLSNGWYDRWSGDVAANCPCSYAGIFVAARDNNHVTQFCFDYVTMEIQRRVKSSGSWGYWEYVNPAMTVGKEYRTIELYKGKTVYTKLINCGTLPFNTSKVVSLGVTATNIVRTSCERGKNGSIPMTYGNIRIDYYVDLTNIHIETRSFGSQVTDTVFVRVWYTK